MTLLDLIKTACAEMGLTQPNAIVSATDKQTIQLLAIANMLGQQMASDFEWQRICKTHTFVLDTLTTTGTVTSGSPIITGIPSTTGLAADTWQVSGPGIEVNSVIDSVDGATQITMDLDATDSGTVDLIFTKTMYDLPTDWNRQINRTHWDRSNHWELMGPKSPQEWQTLKGGIIATGPRVRYRILGGKFQIWPLAVSEANIAYEYVSDYWVSTAAGLATTKSSFTADADVCIFRDRLMINGIKLKFWDVKGFDTTTFERQYENELFKAMAQDKGAPTLSLAPTSSNPLISPANVPDTGFGS